MINIVQAITNDALCDFVIILVNFIATIIDIKEEKYANTLHTIYIVFRVINDISVGSMYGRRVKGRQFESTC